MTPEENSAAQRRREIEQFENRLAKKIADEEDLRARRRTREMWEVSPEAVRKCWIWFGVCLVVIVVIVKYALSF